MNSEFRVILFAGKTYRYSEFIIISLRLRWPNLKPIIANQGEIDFNLIEFKKLDLVILGEDIDGLTVKDTIKRIREFSDIPIIVLGGHEGKAEDTQVIGALEAGADYYIVIPDDPIKLMPNLIVRTGALMRRVDAGNVGSDKEPIHVDNLVVDPGNFEAYLEGVGLSLTSTEFNVLYFLAQRRGMIVSKDLLASTFWEDFEGAEDILKKYIQRLRKKLGDDARNSTWIKTIHGIGYRFTTSGRKEIASDSVS